MAHQDGWDEGDPQALDTSASPWLPHTFQDAEQCENQLKQHRRKRQSVSRRKQLCRTTWPESGNILMAWIYQLGRACITYLTSLFFFFNKTALSLSGFVGPVVYPGQVQGRPVSWSPGVLHSTGITYCPGRLLEHTTAPAAWKNRSEQQHQAPGCPSLTCRLYFIPFSTSLFFV